MPDPAADQTPLFDRDDKALLDAHLAGDAEAFAVLTRRHARLMLFIAEQIVRDRVEAEDVVQSALLAVLRSASHHDGRGSVKSWMCRITQNAALDVVRRRTTRPTLTRHGVEGDDESDGSDVAAEASDRTVVDDLLWELPELTRQIVVMIDLLDLSYARVAEILEIPVGTVKSRRSRALSFLSGRLEW